MRTWPICTLAMPVLLLGLVFVAAFGTSTTSLVLILGVLFAPATARLMRSATLSELECRLLPRSDLWSSAPTWRVMIEEVCCRTRRRSCFARGSIVAADAIFVEASLSFVGLGVPPPGGDLGNASSDGVPEPLPVELVSALPRARDHHDRRPRPEHFPGDSDARGPRPRAQMSSGVDSPMAPDAVLDVRDLSVEFPLGNGGPITPVRGVSFSGFVASAVSGSSASQACGSR